MITEYEIVTDETMDELEETVEEMISEGWQPLGGVVVEYYTEWKFGIIPYQEVNCYAQTMVCHSEVENSEKNQNWLITSLST